MARYGIYKGIVTDTADPEGTGRIRAQVPQVFGSLESDWAWPAQPNMSGVQPFEIGDPVWIMFEAGDPHHPVWIGTWQPIGAELPPSTDVTVVQTQVEEQSILHWMIVAP